MRHSRWFRATAAAAITAAGALTIALPGTAALAGPRPRVGPHQPFDGLVNGKHGDLADPVTIFVGCRGPKHQTGHPIEGQTVEIVPAASAAGDSGNTGGAATSVEAFFGAPPPDAHAATGDGAARRSTVTFHRYDLSRPIPKGLELPCSGTGQVTFIPFPRTPPTSVAAVVHVKYMAQP